MKREAMNIVFTLKTKHIVVDRFEDEILISFCLDFGNHVSLLSLFLFKSLGYLALLRSLFL